jgi:hypothetical protein
MNSSPEIKDLAAALSAAQGEIEGALRGNINPYFRSKYADLSSVWQAIRAPFAKHGLSIVQGLSSTDSGISCETVLLHASGQWVSSTLTIPADKLNAHGYGSAATYARRFALMGMTGIAPVDDDGNAAAGVTAPQEAQQPNPWTSDMMQKANYAATTGEYPEFWKAQSAEFRAAAIHTKEHAANKTKNELAKVQE